MTDDRVQEINEFFSTRVALAPLREDREVVPSQPAVEPGQLVSCVLEMGEGDASRDLGCHLLSSVG